MNIFFTNVCPHTAAQALDDKRVVKMVLETAQMLSSAAIRHGAQTTYKIAHAKHPCTLWVGNTSGNYDWALRHFFALAAEYTHRYGKTHKCLLLAKELTAYIGLMPVDYFTAPPMCTPGVTTKECASEVTTVTKVYQKYMNNKWAVDKRPPVWTKRDIPAWSIIKDKSHEI